jgi:integrase
MAARAFAQKISHDLHYERMLSTTCTRETTFATGLEMFLSLLPLREERSRHTYRSYLSPVLAQWGPRALAGLRPLDLDLYCRDRRSSVSSSSYKAEVQFLKRFFAWAVENFFIPVNPAAHLVSPPAHPKSGLCLTWPQEFGALAAATPRNLPKILLCRDAGLRASDMYRLRRSNIDFEENSLSFIVSKNQKPLRLPVTGRLRASLEQFAKADPASPLFPLKAFLDGKRYISWTTQFLRPIWRALGFRFRLHDLRHTFFTRFYEATKDPVLARYVLGHSMTELPFLYWHEPSFETLTEAFARMEQAQQKAFAPLRSPVEIPPREMWKELESFPPEKEESR